MSYPGSINGKPIFGPPVPLTLFAKRTSNQPRKQTNMFDQSILVDRSRSSSKQQTPALDIEAPRCETCDDLELRKKDYPPQFPSNTKSIPIAALRKTAKSGCPACSMLLEGISKCGVSLHGIGDISLNTLCAGSSLVVIIGDSGIQDDNAYLEFYTKPSEPAKWSSIGPGLEVSHDSSSEECFKLAQKWLKDCLQEHSQCRPSYPKKLPTRVLYVGPKTKDPCLFESEQNLPTGSYSRERRTYAALSHCWGLKKPMITETTSLEKRKAGIPFAELPKTFQDAITVARKLNIDYLWIDSLCILQDSDEDWAREAEQMGTVYANAILTIAADASADALGGLFVTGKGRLTSVEVECPGPSGARSHVYVRPQGIRRNVNEVSHNNRNLGRSKLTTRGWVLQERILSPRTLHYTATEMAWECATHLCCECSAEPERISQHAFKQRYVKTTKVKDYEENAGQGISNSLEHTDEWRRRQQEKLQGAPIILLEWHDVVWEFTARKLTRASDRLPALSGLAATMERATSHVFSTNSYAFGLWRRDIALDLCWQSVEYDGSEIGLNMPSHRQEEYYAPTWSWASVTGRIRYDEVFRYDPTTREDRKVKSQLVAIDVDCTPAGINRFGNAKDGRLTVCGYLTAVKVQIMGNGTSKKQFNGDPHTYYNVVATNATRDGTCPYDILDPDVKGDGYEINLEDEHFVLLVAAEREFGPGPGYCLVLKKVVDSAATYQRVGFLRTRYSNAEDWKELGRELLPQGLVII